MRTGPLSPVLVVLAAVAVLLGLSALRTWREVEPFTGVTVDADGRVTAVAPDGPAEAAGLRAGDVVLEVGGHAARTKLVIDDLLAQAEPGRPVGVVVQRGAETTPLRIEPLGRVEWRADRIVSTSVAILFWVGALAALLRPRRASATWTYVGWCVAGALVLGVTWSHRGDRLDWALFWIDRASRLLLPALWIQLTLALKRDAATVRRWRPLIYAPAAALLLAEIHLVGLGGAMRADDPVALVEWLRGRVEVGWLFAGLVAGLVVLAKSAVAGVALERARARWFLAGTLLALLPFLSIALLPQIVLGRSVTASWLTLPFFGVLPVLFTGAVVEYRLMDLAFFARRALITIATLAFSVVLFLGLLSLAGVIVPLVLHPAGIVPALVAAVITAALAPAIRAGSRDLVGRVFYRRRYNFRRALSRVARDLNAERDLPRLTGMLEQRVREALGAGVARLRLAGPGGQLADPCTNDIGEDVLSPAMQASLERGEILTLAMIADAPGWVPELNRSGVQVLVPLRVESALIAVLAVGPGRGGVPLDTDDLELLRSVAAHAAAAVAGAQHLAELREQVALVQRLQARTEALIESSPIGLAVIDRAGTISQWNPALEQLLGVAQLDALSRPYTEVLPPPLRALVREYLRDADGSRGFAGAGSRAYRVRIHAGAPEGGTDGAPEKLVDLAANPLNSPDGSEGLLLTLDDVTDRVRLEEQLIQQDRLASVGLLAAGVAHEVNTPLTGISSYAQLLLEETAADDPRRPMLEKIVQQAGRASQIARGLLRFSRPGPAGASSFGPVDLRDLLEETVGLLGPQVRKSKARVETRWPGGPAFALADRGRLQQVAINLLLNALDAVNAGGHVMLRAGGDAHECWFEVEDDGIGIPEEYRARIFDPFFTTKKPGQGTGLGLSISYSIVREHGGALTVDSEPGKGTIMRVLLPALAGAVHALPAAGSTLRRRPAAREAGLDGRQAI